MIVIENTIVSDDLAEVKFVCNISKCKGECCVAGDAGAPLELEEVSYLEDYIDEILPYITEEGREAIKKTGVFEYDFEGDIVTPLINGEECAFTIFDNNGVASCGIEKAYEDKKIDFQKPISCHLYPIRITKHTDYEAVNYHKWDVCSDACTLGKQLGVPLYKFLKDPLIRKYGKKWYALLEKEIENK
ncbi:MAG: DUF3109 family protein [Bacteroidota bacterium]|nr:DUF3109 family protein [Bacteroidota bacterium]